MQPESKSFPSWKKWVDCCLSFPSKAFSGQRVSCVPFPGPVSIRLAVLPEEVLLPLREWSCLELQPEQLLFPQCFPAGHRKSSGAGKGTKGDPVFPSVHFQGTASPASSAEQLGSWCETTMSHSLQKALWLFSLKIGNISYTVHGLETVWIKFGAAHSYK